MSYNVGDLVRVTARWANAAGTAVDPATVSVQVKSPAGTTTTYVYLTDVELVKDSTGIYHLDVNANAAGVWRVKAISTGSGQAVEIGDFTVFSATL